MKALKIKDNIYWVGGIDWELRNFHGYLTQRGTTYNAYLIIDEKITLVDTVKYYLVDEMLSRISDIIDPSKIDYIISNHVEMDHSGGLPRMMEIAPKAKIFASPKGVDGLKLHYKKDWDFNVLQNGETLSLGKRTLKTVLTPMVHWPDNMICYMPEDKILFSNDAFASHLASSEMIDDNYPFDIVMEEARKYYANIVMPYNSQVRKALNDLSNIEIEYIATSHGIIWKDHISEILAEYKKWSSNNTDRKAVIVYDTMWGSTEKIAKAIYQVFEEKGFRNYIFNLQNNHISDIVTELINAEYICVGSPTLNKNIMPNVAAFLTYLKGLSPKDRKAIAFGSYGWASQNVKQIEDYLKDSDFDVIESFKVNYVPDEAQLDTIKETLRQKIK